jgi:hypothetical protein
VLCLRLFIETNTTQAKALDEWTCPVDRHLLFGYHDYHDTSVNISSTVAHNDIIFPGFNEKSDMTSAKESVRLMFVHYLLILACSLLILTLVLSILVYYCMLVLPHTTSTTVKIEV